MALDSYKVLKVTSPEVRATLNHLDSPKFEASMKEIADLLRKHGGKTGEELEAEGK